jgi:hypothetical protein
MVFLAKKCSKNSSKNNLEWKLFSLVFEKKTVTYSQEDFLFGWMDAWIVSGRVALLHAGHKTG